MRLYLVRHGEAAPEAEDPRRPLSAPGRTAIERLAHHLAQVSAVPESLVIRHSGKARAAETAEIFAAHLRPAEPPAQAAGLAPGDLPRQALELIEEAAGDLMLVGHLPHLGRLASLLLAGDAEALAIDLPTGGIICLEARSGLWRLNWLLAPSLAA